MARYSHWRRVLSAWWVQLSLWLAALRKRPLTGYRPLVRAEFAEGDFLSQAKFLHAAGYYKAACCMARVAVETRLYRLALVLPGWRTVRRCSIETLANVLYRENALRKEQRAQLSNFGKRTSKHAHTAATDCSSSSNSIHRAEACIRVLDPVTRHAMLFGWRTPTPQPYYDQECALPPVAHVTVTADGFELVSDNGEGVQPGENRRLPR